jgi:hypothetical protein
MADYFSEIPEILNGGIVGTAADMTKKEIELGDKLMVNLQDIYIRRTVFPPDKFNGVGQTGLISFQCASSKFFGNELGHSVVVFLENADEHSGGLFSPQIMIL